MNRTSALTGHMMAVLTTVIWGTTFVSTKVLLQSFAPMEILILRFAVCLVALTLFYPHRLKLTSPKQEWYFLAAGLCGVTLYFLCETVALTHTNASNVGVIVAVSPLFAGIFSRMFFKTERLKLNFFLGFAAAIAGISLISFGGSSISLNPVGDILAFIAAVVWAAYSTLVTKISTFGYNTIQVTRRIFLYGFVFLIPALFFFSDGLHLASLASPVNLLNLLYLGLGSSAVCFITWNTAVKILGSVKTSVYIYTVPVVTIITSALILGERITGTALVGTLLTLLGLVLSENKLSLKVKKARHP